MNKCIILSVKPEHLHKILIGKKTIEIRKSIPKCDLPIDVYLYCTKGDVNLYKVFREVYMYFDMGVAEPFEDFKYYKLDGYDYSNKGKARFEIENGFYDELYRKLNGKIVAKFTLNKVWNYKVDCNKTLEEIGYNPYGIEVCGIDDITKPLIKGSCLTLKEMYEYAPYKNLYAWHIDNLEILKKPMKLNDFYRNNFEEDEAKPCNCGKHCKYEGYDLQEHCRICEIDYDGSDCPFLKVQRPPMSWFYAYKEE